MQKEILFSGKFLTLAKEGRWEYVERVHGQGAVMVVAVTDQRELVLIEEYRQALHAYVIGFPAGISGDEGDESEVESAKRELVEEAGFEAKKWELLLRGPSTPGLTSEMVSLFMARDLVRVSCGGGVDNEEIRVHLAPLDRIGGWLRDQESAGKIIDPRIFAGLYFIGKVS